MVDVLELSSTRERGKDLESLSLASMRSQEEWSEKQGTIEKSGQDTQLRDFGPLSWRIIYMWA